MFGEIPRWISRAPANRGTARQPEAFRRALAVISDSERKKGAAAQLRRAAPESGELVAKASSPSGRKRALDQSGLPQL